MDPIGPIRLEAIEGARARIAGLAIRTPLLPLASRSTSRRRVWLKLECLQPIGSFKIRGAANAMALVGPEALAGGVYTGSAGNMAQGVAFAAKRLSVACRVIVPDTAPETKVTAIRRLSATPVPVPFDTWWSVLREHGHPGEVGHFIHPVSDPAVIAGHGTIGLEILEELPDVRAIVVPYGGGGLSSGIASAVRALRPDVRVFATEVETAAPFAASLAAGEPVEVPRVSSFVDGIGGKGVLPEMWPLTSSLLDGSVVMSLEEIADAIRALAGDAHVIAEGAGACAVAACASDVVGDGDVVAVVSGGNIDTAVLTRILRGGTPR